VMIARGFRLMVVASFCGLVCTLVVCAGSALAATQFSSWGFEAGQMIGPVGVAVDAGGDVYISDSGNVQINKFDGSGNFLLAWGTGVADGANELQTCTTFCEPRFDRIGVFGGLEGPRGVAVDDDPSSSSYGDVYVVDRIFQRVEKYDSSGKFLLMFGGHVNKVTGGNVCVAGEGCQVGAVGTGDGEFSYWPSEGSFIAVGPGGAVYVGDQARVQVFDSSGTWRENFSLSGLSSTAMPSAIAVDSGGDLYVKDEEVAGVREFEPDGVEKGTPLDAGSTTVTALALDSSGDLFVGDSNGGFHVLEYDAAGEELANFGANTVLGENHGMAYSEATKELYVTQNQCVREKTSQCGKSSTSSVWVLTTPPPGPSIDSESATPALRGATTIEATIDPEGRETTYHFEYVDDAQYQSTGFAQASSTPSISIAVGCPSAGSGCFEDRSVSANLVGLAPGGTYHYRIVATSSQGTATGADETFEPVSAALIEGPWASDVAGTSVTLSARIDPLGASTEYRLEYGTSTSYGQSLSGNVGGGMSYVPVSFHRQDLLPGTTYHYRVVTVSEVGTVDSVDHLFKTEPVSGSELTLPDGRAWELVSPADKKGALIDLLNGFPMQAASAGNAVTYPVEGTPTGEGTVGHTEAAQLISRRSQAGWQSEDIELPQSLPNPGEPTQVLILGGGGSYGQFSQDLSSALACPGVATLLSPGAMEGTCYLRNNATGSFTPILTPTNVPPNTKLTGNYFSIATTPDLGQVIISSRLALTPEAVSDETVTHSTENNFFENVYEWSGGRLRLVTILPDGEPLHELPKGDFAGSNQEGEGVFGSSVRAVSSDGRWVAWTWGFFGEHGYRGVYVRDMVDEKTVELGGRGAGYQAMSSDGSRVFFTENHELYEFDTATGKQNDLTAKHGAGEAKAGVKPFVSDVSEDGSYVYFVATGVLAAGGVSGADNLYVSHVNGEQWSTSHVATLSSEDEKDWEPEGGVIPAQEPQSISSRVSPNGRYLEFMSDSSLTGYDNVDVNSGQPDEEVYLYDALSNRVVCASCDPTGARPVGVFVQTITKAEAQEKEEVQINASFGWGNRWLAGSVPGWVNKHYQPRYLSDSGRLFFDSPDALVPVDTDGLADVYEYEPAGVGSCTTGNVTFSEHSDGCVNLISSGTSSTESVFVDASENGNDVFFQTSSRLTAEDYDTSTDVYDAHVCSESEPCVSEPVSPPPCTSGDSCKAAPSPQPAIFGPAPSATFSGIGNVVKEAQKGAIKRKPKAKVESKRRLERKNNKRKKAKKTGVRRASGKGGKR
jgi:hypothetical protein